MSDKQGRAPVRDGVLSIIAADLKVVGELTTEGVVKVDGLVEGNIRAGKQVLVSKDGAVKGDVHSSEVIVGGRIEGSVQANGRVEVQSTAIVVGDIITKRILLHEGGEVNGNLRMGGADLAAGALRSATNGDRGKGISQTAKPAAG